MESKTNYGLAADAHRCCDVIIARVHVRALVREKREFRGLNLGPGLAVKFSGVTAESVLKTSGPDRINVKSCRSVLLTVTSQRHKETKSCCFIKPAFCLCEVKLRLA